MAEVVLVSGLLALLFAGLLQLGFALHVRNTLIWCASEGARVAARAGANPADGVARTRDLIASSLPGEPDVAVQAGRASAGGVEVVEIGVVTMLPVLGMFGPPAGLSIHGRAFAEDQE